MELRKGGGSMLAALVLVVLSVGGAAAGGPAREARTVVHGHGSYVDIEASALAQMLVRKDFTLVNVHVPYEGDIAGTDVSVPFDRVAEHLDRLPRDRSAKLVLYCRTGRMSTIAARELVARGYTNVWHLAGGMVAWARAGYPIVRADR
jgi:rhodanese-related sulfurtransferase